MDHPIYHVTAFEIVAPYTLRIRFDDDSEQTISSRFCAVRFMVPYATRTYSIR